MGDLGKDTAVEPLFVAGSNGDDTKDQPQHFRANLSNDWEIWGPMGGYVAAVALRAAGFASPFVRPASLACHYLSVARFGPVHLEVTTLRRARSAISQLVTMTQEGRLILSGVIWSIGEVEGLSHHLPEPPDVPDPSDGEPWVRSNDGPQFSFWDNFESRRFDDIDTWPPTAALEPRWKTWCSFKPTSTFLDPWIDAARAVILLDVVSWPSGCRPHAYLTPPFLAPSLDLYVAFHEPAPNSPWLLTDGWSPVAGDGLLGWNARLWSEQRRLVASGQGQALFRPIP